MTKVISKPPRDSSWIDYHRKMSDKFRYFVRGDGIDPYYSNGDLSEIIKGISGKYVDVIDWGWQADKWDEMPFKYRFSNLGNTFEYYAREGTTKDYLLYNNPAGLKKNGEWVEQYFNPIGSEIVASFFWTYDGFCSVNHRGSLFTRRPNGKWSIWRGFNSIDLSRPPIEELTTLARRINAKSRRVFYRPIIEFLIEEGMRETEI